MNAGLARLGEKTPNFELLLNSLRNTNCLMLMRPQCSIDPMTHHNFRTDGSSRRYLASAEVPWNAHLCMSPPLAADRRLFAAKSVGACVRKRAAFHLFGLLVFMGALLGVQPTGLFAQGKTPFANTLKPFTISPTSAKLNGMGVANGQPSEAWFEWGSAQPYPHRTKSVTIGEGYRTTFISEVLTGLTPRTSYRCRLVVSNAAGTVQGVAQSFTTGNTLWEVGANGTAFLVTGLSNVVAASGGDAHYAALLSDGTLFGWGYYMTKERYVSVTNVRPYPLINVGSVVSVASGANHTLVLRSDGRLGSYSGNYPDLGHYLNLFAVVPSGLSNVVAIAAGSYHDLAIAADGSISAWGFHRDDTLSYQSGGTSGPYRPVSVPSDLSDIVAVAAGSAHSVVLQADGTVRAWGWGGIGGRGRFGQAIVPVALSNVVSIAAGDWHTLALRADGTITAWGLNTSGQIKVPEGLSNVVAIAAGANQSVCLNADGRIQAWGALATPTTLSNVVSIAVGAGHILAVANSTPTALAQTNPGSANTEQTIALQGGDPDGDALRSRISSLPLRGKLFQYDAGKKGSLISQPDTLVTDVENRVIYAPETDGFGIAWSTFRFTVEDDKSRSAEAEVTINVNGNPRAFTQRPFRIHSEHAILSGSAVLNGLSGAFWFEWGPLGGSVSFTEPKPFWTGSRLSWVTAEVGGLVDGGIYNCRLVVSNAAGVHRGYIRLFTAGGEVALWGINDSRYLVPSGLTNVVAAAGYHHTTALRSDGTVVSWGGVIREPSGLSNVVSVACGAEYTIALQADGTLVGWGYPTNALVPPNCINMIAIASGRSHVIALKQDGTVMSWGHYMWGEAAVAPVGLSNIVAVAAGSMHSLALTIDGTVFGWGKVPHPSPGSPFGFDQDKVPKGLTNVVGVAAGATHNLALLSNGKVVGWGDNDYWQCVVPSSLSNVVEIAGGWRYSMALRRDGTVMTWGYGSNVVAGLRDVAVLAGGNVHNIAIGKNMAPSVSRIAVSGPANRELLVSLGASDLNADGLALRVTTLPVGGGLYQCVEGMRVPIIDANSSVADANNRVVFVPDMNWYGNTSFEYMANDGDISSAPGQVRISIRPPVAPVILGWGMATNGFFVTFTGDSNTIYHIWTSINLVQWACVGEPPQTGKGHYSFWDESAWMANRRFYRISTRCPGLTP